MSRFLISFKFGVVVFSLHEAEVCETVSKLTLHRKDRKKEVIRLFQC